MPKLASLTAEQVLAGRDLSGQNMLVTGCNTGIGFETARALAGHGAHVIVTCRDRAKADDTVARIRALHPDARLSPLALDLGSFASVRAAAAALPVETLHVLICNAGLYFDAYSETEDGLESVVGVSHFGHFLLTSLLLPALRRGAPARVVMVSSESHRSPAELDLARFPLRRERYKPLIAYGQAKLCNVLFANELTRRYQEQGVVATSLHPGTMIGTSISRNSPGAKLVTFLFKPFAKSIAQGAATTVYCAIAPELAGKGGRYFRDCGEHAMSEGARDADVARQLWELSEKRCAQ